MKQHKANADGWTDWDQPVMTGYRLACCDCGLTHNFDFRVLKVTKFKRDGSWEAVYVNSARMRIEFRARRNNRSTAALRRGKVEDANNR